MKIKALQDFALAGEHIETGRVIDVDKDDATNLVSMGRAAYYAKEDKGPPANRAAANAGAAS